MKPLRWKRLQLGQHFKEGLTIWDDVPELPTDEEVTEQLLRLFSKAAPVQRAPSTDSVTAMMTDRSVENSAPKELQIIQGTIQRCGREGALAKLPPAELIANALRDFDQSTILSLAPSGMQLCELLRLVHDNACPTPVQQQKLEEARARNPEQPLGNIERYMWEVSRVPAYNERLECWHYLSTWEEDLRPVRSNIEQFESIVACFRSPALPQLLGVVLAVGNYLNGGTKDGRADGFQLSVLKSGGIDTVRDNQSSGNLRRFVISTWLDKCRKGAATLLVDLRPALKNVKRSLENCEGGSLRLNKQVKVSLERTCDEALSRLQTEFAEKQQMLQVVKQVVDDCSPTAKRMQQAFDLAQKHLADLQSRRDRAADAYSQLLGWLHVTSKDSSEAFFLLWDDFLMPSECFEAQGPSKVKSILKPIFCDDSTEIDVYGLGRLWEVNVGGLAPRSRSTSATPRGRGSSQDAGSRGRPSSQEPTTPLRRPPDWRRQPSRDGTLERDSSPCAAGREAGWNSNAPASRGSVQGSGPGKDGLPPRPRQSSRNASPRRCLSSCSLTNEQPALSRAQTTPAFNSSSSTGESCNLALFLPKALLSSSTPVEESPTAAEAKAADCSPRDAGLTLPLQSVKVTGLPSPACSSPVGPGSARSRGAASPELARAAKEEHPRRESPRLPVGLRNMPSCPGLLDLTTPNSARDQQAGSRPNTHRGAPPALFGEAREGSVSARESSTGGGGPSCGPPKRTVARGRPSVTPSGMTPCSLGEVTPHKVSTSWAPPPVTPPPGSSFSSSDKVTPAAEWPQCTLTPPKKLVGAASSSGSSSSSQEPGKKANLSGPPPPRAVRGRAVLGG